MKKQAPPVQKNETLTVTIEDLTHEGAGVAKVNGYALFIPQALPGETVDIKVVKTKAGYGYGRLLQVQTKSEHRVEPPCPIFYKCGGCQIQHMDYSAQLAYKQKQVKDVMDRVAKLPNVPVRPVIGMDDPWRYRNKSQVPVAFQQGDLVAGFYAKRSHSIVDMDQCIIQHKENDIVVQTVKQLAKELRIPAYQEQSHQGVLRHIVARYGKTTGQVMVVLVTKEKKLPHKEAFISGIRKHVPGVVSIVQNINNKRTNVIFGQQTEVLWGEHYLYDEINGIQFAISARSFYQVNPEQTNRLYSKALEYADLTGNETVIDAYCGIGTISLFLAKKARHVYGVEIVPEAIKDAKRNAKLNQITNATFAVGESEEVIPRWHDQGIDADVIVVDPPRKGCDEALLRTMIEMKPKRIVYVSCNPGTLARDLRILEDGGFKTEEVTPVDMFPQTTHVEAVASLVINS
ncbi:23S rRNA (uracil(1939)-C(5))-methyltransferase RlmD [Shouchella clausii]|uniref:23S rRNA (uracil(1939)-C(5))-methyltransferase RlmD n=1 Tax=Shouchella clausii TaxID=79880 RepID=UPI000B96FF8A|nr:23S rRNA (uracil(1939)-C(5))-methyltransferase RlmD [Shouchella clausii]AST98492.1 23S rRNA (uracil(1939)-C(5))-methyltransferase RlmD [Shouchella clausii]MEB5474890.1 23S rRNA (uracil(1939)-C(5))-methyltransferase RlmD [Shouchella clausii]PTL21621.1 23S rRNA (uracil(1939)-C(5))-methyltransferase RlmD [Shouchella clausii]QNM45729.1 23S rRNA (uracil(1939)-C(5))-methyltransferase RlmD [Shouchella clausii]WQG97304.1 23S rRNA (uracil(1939)-C(5))-methyltransferase RlmD [Shouchella clausii]